MRTCRARSVHLLGGSRLRSLSSTRRDQYILPWLFSIRCLGPASSREPVFPSYRGTATDSGATRSRDYPMWMAAPPARECQCSRLPRFGRAIYAVASMPPARWWCASASTAPERWEGTSIHRALSTTSHCASRAARGLRPPLSNPRAKRFHSRVLRSRLSVSALAPRNYRRRGEYRFDVADNVARAIRLYQNCR